MNANKSQKQDTMQKICFEMKTKEEKRMTPGVFHRWRFEKQWRQASRA
jgi:hypothetical protein